MVVAVYGYTMLTEGVAESRLERRGAAEADLAAALARVGRGAAGTGPSVATAVDCCTAVPGRLAGGEGLGDEVELVTSPLSPRKGEISGPVEGRSET